MDDRIADESSGGDCELQRWRQTSREELGLPSEPPSRSVGLSLGLPDPFGDDDEDNAHEDNNDNDDDDDDYEDPNSIGGEAAATSARNNNTNNTNNRSYSLAETTSADGSAETAGRSRPQVGRQAAGGLSKLLSRATSVTSSSVGDRVVGAVGSVRSAVDSLSSSFASASAQQQQQVESTASYLASKFSSATGQFANLSGASASASGSVHVISRQRVILVLDAPASADWVQQFKDCRRQTSGGSGGGAQSALTSFFSSATAQLTSTSSFSSGAAGAPATSAAAAPATTPLTPEGFDLVEQADFRSVSVLANQSSATAAVLVRDQSSATASIGGGGGSSSNLATTTSNMMLSLMTSGSRTGGSTGSINSCGGGGRIIRPEYVVVRQSAKSNRCGASERRDAEHLRGVVNALDYCLVPLFEPADVWNVFQDRQLVFARLLRVQRRLGKEVFPLIPQVFCQTAQDLLNCIRCSPKSIPLPCLVRTGQSGEGKIKVDNLSTLRDLASILAISGGGCVLEQHLDVKHQLVAQKIGANHKLFRRFTCSEQSSPNKQQQQQSGSSSSSRLDDSDIDHAQSAVPTATTTQQQSSSGRQSAARQTSLSSSVLSSLNLTQQQQQQVSQSHPQATSTGYERVAEMNVRYRSWIESIAEEFERRLDAFRVEIVVTSEDREYIVGVGDCAMELVGSPESQEDDRRSLVELVLSHMNAVLPKDGNSRAAHLSRSPVSGGVGGSQVATADGARVAEQASHLSPRKSSGGGGGGHLRSGVSTHQVLAYHSHQRDRNPGQLSSRSQSMSQSDYLGGSSSFSHQMDHQPPLSASAVAGATGGGSASLGRVATTGGGYLSSYHNPNYGARRGSGNNSSSNLDDISDESQSSECYSARDGLHRVGSASSSSSIPHRQASLSQSLFDSTSTALSSFQKQSLSFFKRLDGGSVTNTPPQSAKSDKGFAFGPPVRAATTTTTSNRSSQAGVGQVAGQSPSVAGSPRHLQHHYQHHHQHHHHDQLGGRQVASGGVKSQSMDCWAADDVQPISLLHQQPPSIPPRCPPAKPPPPPAKESLRGRQVVGGGGQMWQRTQSSALGDFLGDDDDEHARATLLTGAATTTTTSITGSNGAKLLVRHNSALSRFESSDGNGSSSSRQQQQQQLSASGGELSSSSSACSNTSGVSVDPLKQHQKHHQQQQQVRNTAPVGVATTSPGQVRTSDSASVTSGDSNSTGGETTAAEDTMNNLKKTFASIFGDRCD